MKEEYIYALSKCLLFKGIESDKYDELLKKLKGKIRKCQKGETIIHFEDEVIYAGIIIEGNVKGIFLNEDLDEINMSYFTIGDMFAEALSCARSNSSPMEVSALTDTTILFVDLLANDSQDDLLRIVNRNLIIDLASKNSFLNLKVRIVSQKKLRDKIIMYLSSLPKNANGYHIMKYNQTALASFLNANRSALARELKRMEDEGLIQRKAHNIKLFI